MLIFSYSKGGALKCPNLIYDCKNLLPFDGQLYLIKDYLSVVQSQLYFDEFYFKINWESEKLKIFGREVSVPRLMAWYGDPEAHYRYSGVDHSPNPWHPLLFDLKKKIENDFSIQTNSVMLNLYRHGQDSMGCHADNEKELGSNPTIVSLSLGETRAIRFHHIQSKTQVKLDCCAGDMMIMAGEIQHHWKHEIPKTRSPKSPRINLTFRKIIQP